MGAAMPCQAHAAYTRPGMAGGVEQEGDIRKYEEIRTHPAANHNAISVAVAFPRSRRE